MEADCSRLSVLLFDDSVEYSCVERKESVIGGWTVSAGSFSGSVSSLILNSCQYVSNSSTLVVLVAMLLEIEI